VWDNIGWVFLLLLVPVLAKIALVVFLAGVRIAARNALRTGFYLGQAGEFAIVLLALATDVGVVDSTMAQVVLAAMVLSMPPPRSSSVLEPVVKARPPTTGWRARAGDADRRAHHGATGSRHLCGYGRSGQNLARLLGAEEIGFTALDSDPERVSEAADGNVYTATPDGAGIDRRWPRQGAPSS
jgi:CPA2 family monovalent cation:H+ antiporter-2